MIYLSAIVISLMVFVFNTSLLPHFWIQFANIIMLLPFLSMYSLRDKTLFPYFLAVFAGVLYDSTTVGYVPAVAISFLAVILVGKNVFARINSYGVERAGLVLTAMGYLVLLAFDWKTLTVTYTDYLLYLQVGLNILLLLILQVIMYRLAAKYFDWIEKVTQERYR